MSIEHHIEDVNLLVISLVGEVKLREFQGLRAEIEALIASAGDVRILALLRDFEGWETVHDSSAWEDNDYMQRTDPHILKFAFVVDEKWRDSLTMFFLVGLRPVPIEYFSSEQEDEARRWVGAA